MARSVDQNFKFHLIEHGKFQDLAVAVVADRYQVPFLKFKNGKDEGVDAMAERVNIDLGGKNVLTNKNVVVQVKHTENESETFNDATRNRVFGKEKEKVKRLVSKNQLHIYIIVTNYKLIDGQTEKLMKMFKEVEAEDVVAIGYETLSASLRNSDKLQKELLRVHLPCHRKDLTVTPKDAQSIAMLKQYRNDLDKIIDINAFTKAKQILESVNGLVFITGLPGSGKKSLAKKLVVQLFDKDDSFTCYEINFPQDFEQYWYSGKKYIFFIRDMDSETMKKWKTLKDSVRAAIEEGSKFVFVGPSVAFKDASKKQRFDNIYEYLCDGAIDLSDEQFNLSKHEKKEMLKKHIEMGDIVDSPTKEALLKDDMVSHAAEINSPCFPLVAKSLGSHRRLEAFKRIRRTLVATVYDEEFLNMFFEWVRSTNVDSDSSSDKSCESPPSTRRR